LASYRGVASFQPCRTGFVAPRGQSRYRPAGEKTDAQCA
jgi:hypothetical protein